MDLRGKVLIKILKKKLFFGRWEGYKSNESNILESNTWFKVKRAHKIFQTETSSCEFQNDTGHQMNYQIDGFRKMPCKIVDNSNGLVVAEVKKKVTKSGVELGDDVFTLVVEPNIDHSLIMGLVLVYSLMNHNM
ncbi:hypothetical protein LUZ60_013954 [Juncus effusus]|nr:hypothetical protein LUZ60_013954 [Juncus effusus]